MRTDENTAGSSVAIKERRKMEKGNLPEIAKEIIDLIVKHGITVGEFERLILKVKDQFSELIVKEKEH